jgi:hypothetical protein
MFLQIQVGHKTKEPTPEKKYALRNLRMDVGRII